MKVIITFNLIVILQIITPNFGTGFEGKVIFSKCSDFKLRYPELDDFVYLGHVFGIWRVARCGPWGNSSEFDLDCATNYFYANHYTTEHALKYIFHAGNSYKNRFIRTGDTITKGTSNHRLEVENLFSTKISIGGMDVPTYSAFVDSDNGESYAIWATCLEYAPNNKTEIWSILTRERTIDPKLSEKLAKKIQTLSGIQPSELLGVGHTDCFKHTVHNE